MKLFVRATASLFLCAAWSVLPTSANAQIDGYPCNGSPGERQVGVAPPLGMPLCVRDPTPQGEKRQNQQSGDNLKANALLNAAKASAQGLELLAKDPEFQKLTKGYWIYIEPNKDGASSEAPCVATFAHTSGFVTVMASGGPDDAIFGTFRGADIPKPKKQRSLKVTISSDAQPTAKVGVGNYVDPITDLGTLAFGAGNNLKQAMDGMHESEKIDVALDGNTVFSGIYREGSEMKKRFSRCVEARAN